MITKTTLSTKHFLVVIAVALTCTLAFFPSVILNGECITPSDLIYAYTPWRYANSMNITRGENPILSDQMDSIQPQLLYMREALLRGELPLYTDKLQNGTPFLLVIKHNLFFPPLLFLTLVFGVSWGVTICILLLTIVGFVFLYAWLHRLQLKSIAALFSCVAFSFNTYAIQVAGFQMYAEYTLIPVLLFFTDCLLDRFSTRDIAALAFTVLCVATAGYPAGAVFSFSLVGFYAVWKIVSERSQVVSKVLTFGLVGLLTSLMMLPILLGTIDFFSAYDWSHRANYWASHLSPRNLITYVIPYFYGSPVTKENGFNWHTHNLYLGVSPLLLILSTMWFVSWKGVRLAFLLFTLWLFAVLYNLGDVLEHLYRYIPVFSSTHAYNQKSLLAFCLSILVGFGLDAALSKRRLYTVALLVIAASLVALYVAIKFSSNYPTDVFPEFLESRMSWTLILATLSVVSLIIGILLASKRNGNDKNSKFSHTPLLLKRHLALIPALILLFIDLSYVGQHYNPTMPPEAFYPETNGIRFLKKNIGNGKLFLYRSNFLANTPLAFSLPTIAGRGFFDSETQALYRLINPTAFKGHKTQYLFPFSLETKVFSQVFDALGLRYIVAPRAKGPSDIPAYTPRTNPNYLISQKEWNSMITISPGKPISQTFRASKDFSAREIQFNLAKNNLAHSCSLVTEVIFDDVEKTEIVLEVNPGTAKPLIIPLRDYEFKDGGTYRVQLNMACNDQSESLAFYRTLGVDAIRSGALFLGDIAQDGDLLMYVRGVKTIAMPPPNLTHLKVVYDKEMTIWENTRAFPRAWLVSDLVTVETKSEVLRMLGSDDIDLKHQAVVLTSQLLDLHDNLHKQSTSEDFQVSTQELTDTKQRFLTTTDSTRMLVISDNYNHNWHVSIDGHQVELHKVNYLMRGVVVPSGTHSVELVYRPRYMIPATMATVTAAIALVIFALFGYPKVIEL